jgi:hypothetical protein
LVVAALDPRRRLSGHGQPLAEFDLEEAAIGLAGLGKPPSRQFVLQEAAIA